MATLNIMLPSASAVDDFVEKASGLPFDLNLGTGSRIVDAKSILGVLYLGIGRIQQLTAPAEQLGAVKKLFSEYLV